MDKELFKKEILNNAIRWYDFKKDSNLLYVREDIEEIEYSTEKFDTIIIKDYINQIENVRRFLKPDGIMLLLVNNKNGLANAGKTPTYSKAEIEKYLKKLKIKDYKFYYPLPNYEQANTIFSDDYLPDRNHPKLINNVFYDEDSQIKYNEIEAIVAVTAEEKFVDYTNSYIVEIGKRSPIKFVSYNNSRKDEYRLVTKVYEDKVVKEAVNDKAKQHIEQIKKNTESLAKAGFNMLDRYEDGKIISKYMEGKTLYEEVIDTLLSEGEYPAYNLIGKWFRYISDRCEKLDTTYIDLVLENCFVKDGEYFFFDQEWAMEDVPLEFVLYRTINNIYTYNSWIQGMFKKECFWKYFHLEDKLELMKEYEKKLQEKVVNQELIQAYDEEYREKYKNVIDFEDYIKENFIQKILKKLRN